MELIRINDQKLKIMLTPSDMQHFEMSTQRLGEDTEQMRRSFRLLMKEIRKKIAFELDDRRVSVQYFPSREGGCEMFITCTLQEHLKTQEDIDRPKRNDVFEKKHESIYKIAEIGSLLNACKRLQAVAYQGKSVVYRDECGVYYLYLNFTSDSPLALPQKIAFLTEYGTACNLYQVQLYIAEHAVVISEEAVKDLAVLA